MHFKLNTRNGNSVIYIIVLGLFAQFVSAQDGSINGVNFIGPNSNILKVKDVQKVKEINANWISFVPTAIVDRNTLLLKPDSSNPRWSETIEGIVNNIHFAKKAAYPCMIKPHIFLDKLESLNPHSLDLTQGAIWRGDFVAINEADWKRFEIIYEKYILELAEIAEELEVELFCIGTELRSFVVHRPLFWFTLIHKVRKVYGGKLTYSANWDEYDQVPFWKQLDYIGVDAYFPISSAKTPGFSTSKKAWSKISKSLSKLSLKEAKPILFTEYGYRNVDFAGNEPWTHDSGDQVSNLKAQENLYAAFYAAFWDKPWVAGGFLWNWNYKASSSSTTDFNVNNKPVLNIIRQAFTLTK